MKVIPHLELRKLSKSESVYFNWFLKMSKNTRPQPLSASVGGVRPQAYRKSTSHNFPAMMIEIKSNNIVNGNKASIVPEICAGVNARM
jgi:hypothetical protein